MNTETEKTVNAVEQPAPVSGRGLLSTAVLILMSTCFTLIALAPVGYFAVKRLPPRIATIDLLALVEEDQKRVLGIVGPAPAEPSEERRTTAERLSADFAKRLSVLVDVLGQECGCVIINKAALLAGTTDDYTDIVRERLKK